MINLPEQNIIGSEPSKKRKKKPTMKGFCVKNDIINSTLDWIDNINKGVEMGLCLSSDEYAMLDDISNRALKLIKTRRK